MNTRKYLTDFLLTFVVVFVVSVIVTFIYSLLAHGQGVVDWETAFRFAIILGIVLTWRHRYGRQTTEQ